MWFSQNDGAGVRAGRAAEPARPVALPGAESPQGWVHWERLSAKPGHREEESPGLSSWGQEAGWPPSAGCRSACHRRSPRVPGFCPLMGQQGPVTEKMLQSRPHPCGAVAGPVPPRPQEGPAQARCGPPVHRVQQQERRGLQSHARAPGRAAYAGSEPPDLARPCTTPAPARSLSLWGQEAKGGAPAQVAQGGLDWKRVLPGCCPQAAVTRHPGAGKLGGEPRTGEASVSTGAPTPSRQQGRSPARPSEPAGAQEDAVSDPQRAGHCGQVAARVGLHLTRGRLVNWMGARWGREQRDST